MELPADLSLERGIDQLVPPDTGETGKGVRDDPRPVVVAIARQVLDPDVSAGEGLAKLGFEVLLGHGHGNIS